MGVSGRYNIPHAALTILPLGGAWGVRDVALFSSTHEQTHYYY